MTVGNRVLEKVCLELCLPVIDADSENTETRVWLDFALACSHIEREIWIDLENKADEVGRLVNHLIENPEKYQTKAQRFKKE